MSAQCASFRSALEWYGEQIGTRRMPPSDRRRQLIWIREFGDSLPKRVGPDDVTVRDVVLYFAEHCDDFADPVEWYYRYKAIESFFEEMSRTFDLASNQIKGLYDESDIEPELVERIPSRVRLAPVNWSREEYYIY